MEQRGGNRNQQHDMEQEIFREEQLGQEQELLIDEQSEDDDSSEQRCETQVGDEEPVDERNRGELLDQEQHRAVQYVEDAVGDEHNQVR